MRKVTYYLGLALLLIGSSLTVYFAFQTSLILRGDWGCAGIPQGYNELLLLILINIGLALTGSLILRYPGFEATLTRKWPLSEFKRLIAAMVLTGGTVYAEPSTHKYAVRYYGKDLVLHEIFCSLLKRVYGIEVKPAQWRMNNSYMTQVYRRELVEDLLALSPTYTCRGNGFSSGVPAPSAAFLLEAREPVIREAVRLAISSTGYLGYSVEARFNGGERYVLRPVFTFGHLSPPSLLAEYQQVLRRIGIETSMVFNGRFEKKGFLRSKSWRTLEALEKLGGFIPGVKIGSGNFRGVERNHMLDALLMAYRNGSYSFNSRWEAAEAIRSRIYSLRNLRSRFKPSADSSAFPPHQEG
ncbi:hypothetical protein DRO53_03665 [Candidatus Bathyarchaeota archaeon]|nr:MAG: hypothetical protein DRO53_03665 [Candidatus Bathyarchaeota archaeon]